MPDNSPDGAPIEDFGDISETLWRSMLTSLREVRIARRISLRQLSEEIGVHPTHLSRVEKCEVLPNVVLAIRWSYALTIDFGTLYQSALKKNDGTTEIG